MEKNDVSSRKESLNSGSASRDEISSQDEIFTFLHVIVIVMARRDEISTRLRNNLIPE